ncbi:MAG TPA: NADH-ubiquinone oxidoreductase-F iron-sulfur binding region domain-containing protein [Acidimicrobiales bacterium]|nr:NADH-ubiquinone oxidoreductase-F iron-sulfur binding region domain-containing protein [Acidimicrobiales bacterium]
MTTSVSPAPGRCVTHFLLGQPSDLAGHIAAHGPLAVRGRRDHGSVDALLFGLERSGLRGLGGGGFPASVKLAVARSAGAGGTVVVNAMEGEPESDKDKVLLTHVPHLVLDGAQYLAAATRARRIVVCVPLGLDHIADAAGRAMADRRGAGHGRVGETVMRPPHRYVVGEESALANFLDAGVARPQFRPDKGTPLTIGRRAALVHNTETLAHIGLIARYGPDPFLSRGITEEPGTCLVTIGGDVAHPGVVEIDRGTPLHGVAKLAGPASGAQAYLVGGYGGSWVGPSHFATPYSSMSLRTVGASAGVGIVVVLGRSSCGIAESARIARYLASQSAGQCGPCVFGLPAIADDMAQLAEGRADDQLLTRLGHRLDVVDGRGACRHPDGAVRLVRSALSVFADDVEAHRRGRPCEHHGAPTVLRLPIPGGPP